MDQISRLIFDVQARENASKALNSVASASDKAHQGFSNLRNTLTGLGGPFGAVSGYADSLGSALDGTLSKAQKLGLGLTAVGVGLIAVGAKEQQAQSQLKQAIDNTGSSYSDYKGQIEQAVKGQENYAHSAADTMEALQALTAATQDPARALSELGDVANIAAVKHESLTEAASTLTRAQEGQTRALLQFGIRLDGVGTKSEQVDRALRKLHDTLSGQAAASVDTFAGRLKVAEARLEDQLASLSKYGPYLTAAGVALTLYATIEQVAIQRRIADTLAANSQAAAIERVTAAKTAEITTTAGDAEANAGLTASRGLGGLGLIGKFGKGLGIAGIGYLASQMVGTAVGGSAGNYLSDIGSGAAIGAGIGTLVPIPGVGTGVGAVVGGVAGLGAALLGGHKYDPTALNQLAATPFGAQAIQKLLAFDRAQGSMTWQQQGAAGSDPRYNYQNGLSGKQLGTLQNATEKQLQAALDATAANRQYATSLLQESNAATKAALSLDGQVKALLASVGKTEGLAKAQDDLQASMHAMAQSVHDGTHALEGHSLAAEANRTALRDSVDKMLALIQAEKDAGVNGYKVRQSALDMADALRKQAGAIFDNQREVDGLLRQLGVLPDQIAKALGATELVAEAVGRQVIDYYAQGMAQEGPVAAQAAHVAASQAIKGLRLGDLVAGGQTQSYIPKSDKALNDAKKYGTDTSNAYVNSYVGGIDSTSAKSKAQQAAQHLAQSTEQQVLTAYRQIRDQIVNTFNLTSLPQKTDLFGMAYGPARLDQAANQYVRQLETWAHLLGELRKKGLNETAVEQFEAAGVAAIPAMRQVLKDKEIGTLNKDFRIIRGIGSQVAGAQVSATDGGHIADVLARLPDRLATKLREEFKRIHIDVAVHEVSKHQAKHVRVR